MSDKKTKTVEISPFLQKNGTILKAILAAQSGIKPHAGADPERAPPAVLVTPSAARASLAPPNSPVEAEPTEEETGTNRPHPHAVNGIPPAPPKKQPVPAARVVKGGRWF